MSEYPGDLDRHVRKRHRNDSCYDRLMRRRSDVIEPETFTGDKYDEGEGDRNSDVLDAYPEWRKARLACRHTPVLDDEAREGVRRGLVLIAKRRYKFERGMIGQDWHAYCDAEVAWLRTKCRYTKKIQYPLPTFTCGNCHANDAPYIWQRNDEDGGASYYCLALNRYCLRCHTRVYQSYFDSTVNSLDEVRRQILPKMERIV